MTVIEIRSWRRNPYPPPPIPPYSGFAETSSMVFDSYSSALAYQYSDWRLRYLGEIVVGSTRS